MTQNKYSRLEAFVSLAWYDIFIRFVANFIAKTSELLLCAGLVVSSANFLTDGTILGTTTPVSQAWAWAQALAIDSGLAVSFYHVLESLKQRDWIKCVLTSVLTGLLAVVAGTITNVDIFSHAIHVPISSATSLMGLDIKMLSILRSVAVVGFVLMSRLHDVSLKDLSTLDTLSGDSTAIEAIPSQQDQEQLHKEQAKEVALAHLTVEEVSILLQVLTRSEGAMRTNVTIEPDPSHYKQTTIEEESQRYLEIQSVLDPALDRNSNGSVTKSEPLVAPQQYVSAEPGITEVLKSETRQQIGPRPIDQGSVTTSREERLERAYQELVAEGRKISGRTLAARAHLHRSSCTQWLRAYPKTQQGDKLSTAITQEQGIQIDRSEGQAYETIEHVGENEEQEEEDPG